MTDIPKLLQELERQLNIKITQSQLPPQGMDSQVIIIKDNHENEYAVKHGEKVIGEKIIVNLLRSNNVDIPIPDLITDFKFENRQVLVYKKISYPLLESIPTDQMYKYIPSMLDMLRNIHKVKSDNAGYIVEKIKYKKWKDFLLSIFIGNRPSLNWDEIAFRPSLDKDLVKLSINNVINKINAADLIEYNYSLLHGDFNQRNLFVDPNTNQITSVIDWSEAMYGDPLFDFARVRMYIWHFQIEGQILDKYYNNVKFTPKDKEIEELYWVVRVIEYLAYYSENLNDFTVGRIRLHQNFLRRYNWNL